jgi:hypothetical protein
VPLLLALVGGGLIIAGQLNLDQPPPGPSLPPIGEASASPTPNPSWVAVQIEIQTLPVINLKVHRATTKAQCSFPPEYDAWLLQCGDNPATTEPGRGGNTYIFAHARRGMFLPLWNIQLGAEIKILMSDGQVLRYRVTEVHPNVSCPDSTAPTMPPGREPLALKYAPPGCAQGAFWTGGADHERLTLQTSQGYNRNWGEFIVVADPVS